MGMYDKVAVKLPCPHCKNKTGGFQTKDRNCDMDTIPFDERISELYTHCDHCSKWVRYYVNWHYRTPQIRVEDLNGNLIDVGILVETKEYEIFKEV